MKLDPETRFHAMFEVATRMPPGPDGKLSPEAKAAIFKLAGIPTEGAQMSVGAAPAPGEEECCEEVCEEYYGTEPPGKDWTFCGYGKWTRPLPGKEDVEES